MRLIMRARKQVFDILIEEGEDGYFIASVPALPGCHTQAKSLDILMRRVRDAIRSYLDTSMENVHPRIKVIGLQRIEING